MSRGSDVKSLTGTGIFLTMYSQTTSMLYFSCADMGMMGAPSATVPAGNTLGRGTETESAEGNRIYLLLFKESKSEGSSACSSFCEVGDWRKHSAAQKKSSRAVISSSSRSSTHPGRRPGSAHTALWPGSPSPGRSCSAG